MIIKMEVLAFLFEGCFGSFLELFFDADIR